MGGAVEHMFKIQGPSTNDVEKRVTVNVSGVNITFKIDSCSTTNIISSYTYELCKKGMKCTRSEVTNNLYPYNSQIPLQTLLKFECKLQVGRFATIDEVYVVKGNDKSLLSERTSQAIENIKIWVRCSE